MCQTALITQDSLKKNPIYIFKGKLNNFDLMLLLFFIFMSCSSPKPCQCFMSSVLHTTNLNVKESISKRVDSLNPGIKH